jgi:hypothetical protein
MELPLDTLFESPSVRQLGRHLQKAGTRRGALTVQQRPTRIPLSYAQRRLWFIDRLGAGSPEYNISEALHVKGELDRQALTEAIHTIVERHESLRTHFREQDGEPEQIIESAPALDVSLEDLRQSQPEQRQQQIQALLRQQRQQPFDLAHGPLLRIQLLQLAPQEYILVRTMHHIVSDGWSQGVFNRELTTLYESYRKGCKPALPALPVQYADFAIWQRSWLQGQSLEQGLHYWKQQLAGIPDRLELPTDRPRPALQTFAAEICRAYLAPPQVARLKQLSRRHQATLYMTLLASFGVLLARYSGQDDIVVGSPIANRQEANLEQMIGFFVNPLVLRMRIKPAMSFADLLAQVRRTALDSYEHQDVPFERLVEEISPQRSLNSSPIFQVVFTMQDLQDPPQMKDLQVERLRPGQLQARFDLLVHTREREGGVDIVWLYNRDLFDRWRIEQMARHYVRILDASTDTRKSPRA